MRRALVLFAAPCVAFSVILFGASREAHAGLAIAADGHLGVALSDPNKNTLGGGLSGRVGFRIDLINFDVGPLFITPEIGGGYWTFGDAAHPGRIFAGGRIGLGSRFQPALFGHAGYGLVRSGASYNYEGFTADGGLSLEFQIVPTLGVGIHGGYVTNRYSDAGLQKSVDWVDFGLQVTINL